MCSASQVQITFIIILSVQVSVSGTQRIYLFIYFILNGTGESRYDSD